MFSKERWIGFVDDESGGERDTLTTLLILAVIIIPLVLGLVFFRDKIMDLAKKYWEDVTGKYQDYSS